MNHTQMRVDDGRLSPMLMALTSPAPVTSPAAGENRCAKVTHHQSRVPAEGGEVAGGLGFA